VRSLAGLLLLACAAAAGAGGAGAGEAGAGAGAEDDDSAALALPGVNGPPAAAPGALAMSAEAALTAAARRLGGSVDEQRLSLDIRYDALLAPGWRAIVADRLDLDWAGAFDRDQQINTLKEAYLNWQPQSSLLLDAGRINVRQGVAYGYNPTDFLRVGALRTIDSLDPDSLRENRFGTVMLRGQTLWAGGSLTMLYAPQLPARPTAAAFDPDLGATNAQSHWMVALSQRIVPNLTPQWLLFGVGSGAPQLGLNLSSTLGASTVAYVEVSGGRMPSSLQQALAQPGDAAIRSRLASGLTYSAPNKLSLTIEYEYDGAGLSRDAWSALQQGNPAVYGRYREFLGVQQDPPTQRGAFLYLTWQDLVLRHLDLTAFTRVDLCDHSGLPWAELRYHWSHIDAAVRWQNYLGSTTSDYGASPTGQTWQALLDYYL
jgi:hypothetical protein